MYKCNRAAFYLRFKWQNQHKRKKLYLKNNFECHSKSRQIVQQQKWHPWVYKIGDYFSSKKTE